MLRPSSAGNADLGKINDMVQRAKRRLGVLTAWIAIFAVAGISYAARRRQTAVPAAADAEPTDG